jgi:hypothetical protein
MVRVFVVADSNTDAATFAAELYSCYEELRPAPTRRWEMALCHLVHGNAYDEVEAAIRRQSFTLFYGFPWSHVKCELEMRRRFPDALWVRAEATSSSAICCFNPDCDEDLICEDSDRIYTTKADLDVILPPRMAPCVYQFPCACTTVPVVDCGSGWMFASGQSAEIKATSCFQPLLPAAGQEDVLHIYVDWLYTRADPANKKNNIAWVVESYPVVPGCLERVLAAADNFSRVVNHGSCTKDTETHFGRVPYSDCWISIDEIKSLGGVTKQPLASIIASSKRWAPGHAYRHEIISACKPLGIHVFGNGYGPAMPRKFPALGPYMYSIIVENCISPGYFTEKLVDCLACRCVAFYWGAPDVHTWYDPGSVIPFTNLEELQELLAMMSAEDYASRMEAINANQHRSLARRCPLHGLALDTNILSLDIF